MNTEFHNKIAIIITGGTLIRSGSGEVRGVRSDADIPPWLEAMPELRLLAQDVDVRFFKKDEKEGSAPDVWRDVALFIYEKRQEYQGFVIVSHVENIAYFAQALDLMFAHCSVPIVFTGSQLPDYLLSNQGNVREILEISSDVGLRANLINALQVIRSGNVGIMVLFADKALAPQRLQFKQPFLAIPFLYSPEQVLIHVEFSIKRTAVYEKRLIDISEGAMQFRPYLESRIAYFEVTPVFDVTLIEKCKEKYKGIVLYFPSALSYPDQLLQALITRSHEMPILLCGEDVARYRDFARAHALVVLDKETKERAIIRFMVALGETPDPLLLSKLLSS